MVAEEEWERPIGLTKEWAICVDDDSDDDGASENPVVIGDKNGKANATGTANGPISSYFRSDADVSKSESSDGGRRTNAGKAATTNKYTSNENADKSGSLISSGYSQGHDIQPASDSDKIWAKSNGPDNPFASFAFNSSSSWRPTKRPRVDPSTSKRSCGPQKKHITSAGKKNRDNMLSTQAHPFFAKKSPSNAQLETADTKQKKKTDRAETREELLIAKWHAFADPNAPIEQQRFQVLVASRIHARCQEKVVLQAMDRLRKHFDEKDDTFCDEEGSGDKMRLVPTQHKLACYTQSAQPHLQGLTVHALAKSNPVTEIAPLLSSVLFGNTKANQIVQAAQDVISKFGGKVPESQCSLKEISGIGPKLAEILSIVNRRGTYA